MQITLRNISKSFGNKEVIPDLSLKLEDNKFTTLLGPSGCGKTTLLRMIAGLESPDAGEILFDDDTVFSKEKNINIPPERRNLSFVFQDFALWPHMTVFENVAFGLRARKMKADLEERVIEALKRVKLNDYLYRYPHELSGGQQQRVAFARAIVVQPRCVLFDEPLSALDAQLRENMRAEIKQLTDSLNITSVFVTHDQAEAMSMSDYIVVMNGGRVEQYGIPVEIYERPATPFVAGFVGKVNRISDEAVVRPEQVTLSESQGKKKGKVLSSQYYGGHYNLILATEKGNWTVSSSKDYVAGVELYVDYDEGTAIALGE